MASTAPTTTSSRKRFRASIMSPDWSTSFAVSHVHHTLSQQPRPWNKKTTVHNVYKSVYAVDDCDLNGSEVVLPSIKRFVKKTEEINSRIIVRGKNNPG